MISNCIKRGFKIRHFTVSSSYFVPEVSFENSTKSNVERLVSFFEKGKRVAVITGAGVSTESGIPDYRGEKGSYKHGHKPMMHNEFVSSLSKRRRYWARSLVGWKYFDDRRPNYVHESLSFLEREGYVSGIVTQNVDRLHHRAGSKNVVELHGRNDVVRCMSCHADESRTRYQERVLNSNKDWVSNHMPFASDPENVDVSTVRADGDANVEDKDLNTFQIPGCSSCEQGVVMPRIVFFGGSIEKYVKDKASNIIEEADKLLILGSSCQVYSAYRLVRTAFDSGMPIAAVNIGEMRVDNMLSIKLDDTLCSDALRAVVNEVSTR